MKKLQKLLLVAAITISMQQQIQAGYVPTDDQSQKSVRPNPKNPLRTNKKRKYEPSDDQQQSNSKKQNNTKRQGWGRFGTAIENAVTLHPLNSANAIVTGEQEDTTFGYERNENGRIKAREANTRRNRKNDNNENQTDENEEKGKGNKYEKNSGWSWFGKKSKNKSDSDSE